VASNGDAIFASVEDISIVDDVRSQLSDLPQSAQAPIVPNVPGVFLGVYESERVTDDRSFRGFLEQLHDPGQVRFKRSEIVCLELLPTDNRRWWHELVVVYRWRRQLKTASAET